MRFRIKRPKLHVLPRPEQKLSALAYCSPQAIAFAERLADRTRPALTKLHSIRRRLATGGVIVLTVWLFVHIMFGANGMVVYRQKRTEYQSLQKEINSLQKENHQYTEQIKSLETDPKTIEKEAREQLHYARPGEVIYVEPPPPAPKPSTDAARK
jgi:cell division protein FtsB